MVDVFIEDLSLFDYFAKRNFNSIELLINLNSFGFIREACHAMGTSFDAPDVFEDLVEYDPTKLDATEKSIRELNEIAGGDYWQAIIAAYKKKEIDGYEAESQFAEQYCMRLIRRKTMIYKTGVEYGDYTINHVLGCSHGCKYPCYAYMMKKRFGDIASYEEWCEPALVENTLEILDDEIPKFKSKIHMLHLCFTTDPFMYEYDEVGDMSFPI